MTEGQENTKHLLTVERGAGAGGGAGAGAGAGGRGRGVNMNHPETKYQGGTSRCPYVPRQRAAGLTGAAQFPQIIQHDSLRCSRYLSNYCDMLTIYYRLNLFNYRCENVISHISDKSDKHFD